MVFDRGLASERRVAALALLEDLDPFEHRVGELGPIVPGLAAIEKFGLHRCEARFSDSVVEHVSDAAHRREQSGLAQTPSDRQGKMLRFAVAVKDCAECDPAAPVRDAERVDDEFGPEMVRNGVADDDT